MTTEQKRNSIEENYINGNITDAKQMFKNLQFSDRKDFVKDAFGRTYLMEFGNNRINQFRFAEFLIDTFFERK